MCSPMYHTGGDRYGYQEVKLFFASEEDRQCWVESYLEGGKFDWTLGYADEEEGDDIDDIEHHPWIVHLKLI